MPGVPGKPKFNNDGRTCRRCGDFKAWGEYTNLKRGLRGKAARCKTCEQPRTRAYLASDAGLVARRRNQKAYRERHPDRVRAQLQAWHDKHPEYVANRVRNPESLRAAKKKRRAKQRGACPDEGALTTAEWLAIKAAHNHTCKWCGTGGTLEQDHVVPISRGGLHVKENIVPACRSCNAKKGSKPPEEWEMRGRTGEEI